LRSNLKSQLFLMWSPSPRVHCKYKPPPSPITSAGRPRFGFAVATFLGLNLFIILAMSAFHCVSHFDCLARAPTRVRSLDSGGRRCTCQDVTARKCRWGGPILNAGGQCGRFPPDDASEDFHCGAISQIACVLGYAASPR